jgi:DDE superfamily endonuclease
MDKVPIPFKFLDGYTYHICREKTITGKTDRSGWGKRQATLILYIFADGIPRISPKLIFHGKPNRLIRSKESHLYHPGVTVEFNDTAYNNGDLFDKWINEELAISLIGDGLLIMDYTAFYKTESALLKLWGHCILPALIPRGYTSLLQPLDVSINKPFKEWLREVLNKVLN